MNPRRRAEEKDGTSSLRTRAAIVSDQASILSQGEDPQ